MDWLVEFQAKLDCAARTLELTRADGDIVIYYAVGSMPPDTILPQSPEISLYLMEGMEDLPPPEMHELDVVCEFPDVFPDLPLGGKQNQEKSRPRTKLLRK